MKRQEIFNVCFDPLTTDQTLDRISEIIEKREICQHVVINVAKLVYAQENQELRNAINQCGLINVDGAGVMLGAKMLGIDIPERVAGIDLMEKLVEKSSQKGYKIYFLGAKQEILDRVIEIYKQKYPNIQIVGSRDGYFTEEQEVAEDIKQSKADILFVAISSPKKELFLNKYVKYMEVPFVMGVGGSFDVVAGKVSRAPLLMQKWGLEWLHRLLQEPGRMWKRYTYTNTIFLIMVLRQLLTKKTTGRVR